MGREKENKGDDRDENKVEDKRKSTDDKKRTVRESHMMMITEFVESLRVWIRV